MKTKEIIVIGAGIAGCAVALALAKRGIAVTILTSPLDQRIYHGLFVKQDDLDEKVKFLQSKREEYLSCSRAHEQLALLARKGMDELLESHYLDRNGHLDIHRCLQEQLKLQTNVEWITHHSAIELLTLDQHSFKKADRYKKPTCAGVVAYNHDTQKVDYFLAKETILATGGASSLYPYSTHSATSCGDGLAMAYRAGARLLNMDQVQFHPLGLYEKDRPCFPLPIELLAEGGKILSVKSSPLEIDLLSSSLNQILYDYLLKTGNEHLWLDLTLLNHEAIKDKYPSVDSYCLNHGFNLVKDLLPIVPVASYTCGGIAVDRVGQTSLQRLRAVGEAACTGLFWNFKEESLSILESLTWAMTCAEDIAKQTPKLIYYFPDFREGAHHVGVSGTLVEEDWKLLRKIMWYYVGIKQDRSHLERGCALLDQLYYANSPHDGSNLSIEQIQLFYAIQTAQLIANSAKSQNGIINRHSFSNFSLFHKVEMARL